MQFTIRHTTRYSYDGPVTLGPVLIRLRPRCDCTQRLDRFEIRATPAPAGSTQCADLEGNATCTLWFEGTHDHLSIVTTSDAEITRANPFGFIVADAKAARLPAEFQPPLAGALHPYLTRIEPADPAVDELAARVADETGREALPFLLALSRDLASRIRYARREFGNPASPAQTLATGEGACRDTAALFMDACRAVGLPARFVSGYAQGFMPGTPPDLHAWAEVYLPGGGWRGFDPTMGMAVAERHIALAAAAIPELAAPIDGTFVGSPRSHLWFEISIRAKGSDDDTQTAVPPRSSHA